MMSAATNPWTAPHNLRIGDWELQGRAILAPMAGVTDLPFRRLARTLGASLTVTEMVSSKPCLRNSAQSRLRLEHHGEPGPVSVQIAGTDPESMADAARYSQDQGAQIIDINMGCPAKKVCRVMAGSALLRDEALVARILTAVVAAVDIPVTLKIRTGWDRAHRNAVAIARIAEDCGVRMLAIHGRTRADAYRGRAEYDTTRTVVRAVSIPVIANGDIDSAVKARRVLDYTGARGVMIGRAAQGRPWIFREIRNYLDTGCLPDPPNAYEIKRLLLTHLRQLHHFYGEGAGVRIARKHIRWYCTGHPGSERFWQAIREVGDARRQRQLVSDYFENMADKSGAAAADRMVRA